MLVLCGFIILLSLAVGAVSLFCLFSRRLRRQAQIGLGVSLIAFIVAVAMIPVDKSQVATAAPTAPAVLAAITAPPLPQVQASFVATVDQWRKTYATGANDMAKGATRPARAKDICSLIKSTSIDRWIGTVETLSSNSDGLGVLSVKIGDDIALKTWNNSVSDVVDHTLIDPASNLFRQATSLKVGQRVAVSGTFIPSKTDCFREGSMTLAGSLQSPEYIFHFADIAAVD
jgi:hypothetical protein